MSAAESFDYAGARLQARYGAGAPDPTGASMQADPHAIELSLRQAFRAEVAEVSSWLPADWSPAVQWMAWLPALAALAYLGRQRPPLPWMSADPVLAPLVAAGSTDDLAATLDAGAGEAGGGPGSAWITLWRRRWPPAPRFPRRALEAVAEALQRSFGARVAGIAGGAPGTVSGHAREEPTRVLRQVFRRHTREPAGVAAYLALRWLALRRLRGELLARRLLGAGAGEADHDRA